jgi:predicted AlkP superfamily phosphohydrolase/phosphomutase
MVDVHRSRCFPVENGLPVGAIRLNLAGREPHGVLQPGTEADTFCDELREQLLDIVDGRTGTPLVTAVHRTASLYRGEHLDWLPDLLVEWNPGVPTGTRALAGGRGAHVRATSARIGTVDGANTYGRTGDHLPTGFFVFAQPGRSQGIERPAVSLMDFHPTICRLMGVPAGSGDGAAIPEIILP